MFAFIQMQSFGKLNEHALNIIFNTRMRYFRESRSMRAEYKRGVVRPEVLGHAHKYGGQIQTQSKAIYIDRVSALHITQARSNTIFG